jgi:Ca2+-binding EF-hand superfamily protein
MLAKFDKDMDGKLSPEERVPMIKERMKLQPKFAAMLKEKFDGDKDGELSDPELLEAVKKMPKRGKRGERGAKAGPSGDGIE